MPSPEDRYSVADMMSDTSDNSQAPLEVGERSDIRLGRYESTSDDTLHIKDFAATVVRYRIPCLVIFVVVLVITFIAAFMQEDFYRVNLLMRYEKDMTKVSASIGFQPYQTVDLTPYVQLSKIPAYQEQAQQIALGRLNFYNKVFNADPVINAQKWKAALILKENNALDELNSQLTEKQVKAVMKADVFSSAWLEYLSKHPIEDFKQLGTAVFGSIVIQRSSADKNMLNFTLTGTFQDEMACIANAMALTLMRYEVESKQNKEIKTALSLKNVLKEKRLQLEALEEEVKRLGREQGLMTVDQNILQDVKELEKMHGFILNQIFNIESELQANQLALDEKIIELKNTPKEIRREVYDNVAAVDLENKKKELERLSLELQDKHPSIVTLKKDIEFLEKKVKENSVEKGVPVRFELVGNPIYESIYNEKVRLNSRITMLSGSLTSKKNQIKDLEIKIQKQNPTADIRIKNDRIAFFKSQIDLLQQNIELKEFETALADSHFNVLSAASRPKKPVGPDRTKNIILGVLIGLVMAVATAFVFDYLDATIHSESDISRHCQLETFGSIPEIRHSDEIFIDPDNVNNHLTETYEMIKHNLMVRGEDVVRKILVTSSVQNEGKSTVSLNLAVSLASEGKRVVLVDMDFRKSETHPIQILYKPVRPIVSGLSDYADSDLALDAIFYPTLMNNLYYIPAGLTVNNPSRLLRSERIWRLFSQLEEKVDALIIDSPAMISFVDSYLIAQQVRSVLLVFADEITPINVATGCLKRLRQFHAPILGAILNRSTTVKQREYYEYYSKGSKKK